MFPDGVRHASQDCPSVPAAIIALDSECIRTGIIRIVRGFETLSKWTGPRLYQMAVADPDSIGLRHYQHGRNTERG